MARIAGVDIPRDKRVIISITYIHGIGPATATKIMTAANVSPDTRVKDLTEDEVTRIRDIVDKRYRVEGDVRREVSMNIKRLMEIGAYRGVRHRRTSRSAVSGPRPMPASGAARVGRSASGGRSNRAARGESWLSGSAQRTKREKKNVPSGHAHIQATFNNTIVTITDPVGGVIAWGSAGLVGFKGSRKSTPYAAAQTADLAARKAMEHGVRQVEVFVKGPGAGRSRPSAHSRPRAWRSPRSRTSPPFPTTAAAHRSGDGSEPCRVIPIRSAGSAAAKGSSSS